MGMWSVHNVQNEEMLCFCFYSVFDGSQQDPPDIVLILCACVSIFVYLGPIEITNIIV